MIQIRDLHKYFGPLHVLKGINLEVKKGEVLSVIGSFGLVNRPCFIASTA